jgi:hypothetical protein
MSDGFGCRRALRLGHHGAARSLRDRNMRLVCERLPMVAGTMEMELFVVVALQRMFDERQAPRSTGQRRLSSRALVRFCATRGKQHTTHVLPAIAHIHLLSHDRRPLRIPYTEENICLRAIDTSTQFYNYYSPSMAPSPRKPAPQFFEQSWHETDSIAFDPASLPLSRAPRAWERKPERATTRDGKQKKIWRRYPLRSQPSTAVDEDATQDSRSRAVKKLRVRPENKEDSASRAGRKTRAARGTRWDRRRSVLPSRMHRVLNAIKSD